MLQSKKPSFFHYFLSFPLEDDFDMSESEEEYSESEASSTEGEESEEESVESKW